MFRLQKRIGLLLLLSADRGHSQQQSNASLPTFDVGPDSIEPCAVDGKCDATVCAEKYTNKTGDFKSGVWGVGFHSYVLGLTGPEETKFGVQYYVCACNMKSATNSWSTLSSVQADSVCKINEHKLQLPEDSTETCPENAAGDRECVSYCNDVTFQDWKEANTFPEGSGGMAPVGANDSTGCTCFWADERIEGCTLPVNETSVKPPDDNSGVKPLVAIGLALFTTAAVSEVMTFL